MKGFSRWLDQARAVAERLDKKNPSFWNSIILAEVAMLQHLATGELAAHKTEILNGYLHGKRRGASPREFRSVREHLQFLLVMLAGSDLPESAVAQRRQLEQLEAELLAALG